MYASVTKVHAGRRRVLDPSLCNKLGEVHDFKDEKQSTTVESFAAAMKTIPGTAKTSTESKTNLRGMVSSGLSFNSVVQLESKQTMTLGQAPRAKYHRMAEAEPEKYLRSRATMIACYMEESRRMEDPKKQDGWNCYRQPPAHTTATRQWAYTGSGESADPLDIRVLQWNVNVLTGADSRTPILASSIMEVIAKTNADVVLLQEAAVQKNFKARFPWADMTGPCGDRATKERYLELQARLRDAGYHILTAPSENPALIATRLPVASAGTPFNIDGRFADQMQAEGESRSCRFVQLALAAQPRPGETHIPTLGVFVTHMHHTEAGKPGLRAEETRVLLDHWQKRRTVPVGAGLLAPSTRLAATLLATDMNGTRARDYSVREWSIVSTQLRNIREPVQDGVAEMLESNGFICSYDRGHSAAPRGEFPAPVFTHWTNTTVDYAFLNAEQESAWSVPGVYVLPAGGALSDHLPVVTDMQFMGCTDLANGQVGGGGGSSRSEPSTCA